MTTSSSHTPGEFPGPRDHAGNGSGQSGMPYYRPGHDQYGQGPQGQHPAPPEHARLLKLTLASAGLYVLNAIASLLITATADLTATYERMGLPADQARAMADQAGGSSAITNLIVLVIALGLYALIYANLKKGRNWARILGIVLAILSIIGTIVGFFGSMIFGGWTVVLIAIGLAVLIVDILWLVTAFKDPVRAWFIQQR